MIIESPGETQNLGIPARRDRTRPAQFQLAGSTPQPSSTERTQISNRLIICIASNWELDPTSKHHVMRLLARNNRIVWVNYHGTRRPTLSVADFRSSCSAITRVLRGPQRVGDSTVHMTPLVIPSVRNGLIGRWNQLAVIAQIRRVVRKMQPVPARPVQIWSFAPDVSFLAGHFGEEKFVYYCVDDFAEFEGFDNQAIRTAEQKTLDRSDVVITSARALYDAKRRLHPNVHLVRHGVDVKHFLNALNPNTGKPADVAGLTEPTVGFFGLVHNWIDVELLTDVARRLPHVRFVLVGDVFVDVSALRALPNVLLLGRKPYASLPAYCAAFDVAILPFKCNGMTAYVNPIKLREYLAAGLPVVSTPMPEATLYPNEVTIASGAAAFADACEEAMKRSSLQERIRRSRCVVDEDWEAVVEKLGRIVMSNGHSHPSIAGIPAGRELVQPSDPIRADLAPQELSAAP